MKGESDVKRRRVLREEPTSPSLVPGSPLLGRSSPPPSLLCSPSSGDSHSDREVVTSWWRLDMPEVDAPRRFALEALREYFAAYAAAEKDSYWQRKSEKVVLSVAVCRSRNGGFVAYRGMNTEVCLSSGTLCAERAAIVQAASSFHPASAILVLATLNPDDKINPLWPCGVCQEWISKIRRESPSVASIAVQSSACDTFAVRVGGELQPPPLPPPPPSPWVDRVVLADGVCEAPWQARELVYIDGAWSYLHLAHQQILRIARSRGTNLLVGVHTDEELRAVFKEDLDERKMEDFETRVGRILQNRHVDYVLRGAPWVVTREMIETLGIRFVITGSIGKAQDLVRNSEGYRSCNGAGGGACDPYRVPRELGILEVVPSSDDTTEWKIQDRLAWATAFAHQQLQQA